jgi:hypothetical protein
MELELVPVLAQGQAVERIAAVGVLVAIDLVVLVLEQESGKRRMYRLQRQLGPFLLYLVWTARGHVEARHLLLPVACGPGISALPGSFGLR